MPWIVKISGCGAEFKCMYLNKQKSFSELRIIDAESFCQEKKWMKGREIRGNVAVVYYTYLSIVSYETSNKTLVLSLCFALQTAEQLPRADRV